MQVIYQMCQFLVDKRDNMIRVFFFFFTVWELQILKEDLYLYMYVEWVQYKVFWVNSGWK